MSILADKMPLHILVNKFDEEFWWITCVFWKDFHRGGCNYGS